jgi:calcineurin-like phosphoesterase family protein
MSKIFVTSDNHWHHNNIRFHCNRPFDSVEEMNETMIERWNKVVKINDTVYHLGDFSLSKNQDEIKSIFKKLNGSISIIRGNHDYLKDGAYYKIGFKDVSYYKELKLNKQLYCMSHYPFLTWRNAHHGSINLTAHSHGSLNSVHEQTRRLDVGVDNFDFYPISIEQINEIMKDRTYQSIDHHK